MARTGSRSCQRTPERARVSALWESRRSRDARVRLDVGVSPVDGTGLWNSGQYALSALKACTYSQTCWDLQSCVLVFWFLKRLCVSVSCVRRAVLGPRPLLVRTDAIPCMLRWGGVFACSRTGPTCTGRNQINCLGFYVELRGSTFSPFTIV